MQDAILEVSNISKTFGGVRAIDNVSFALEAGQVLGLIGPNGAGKTTVFNAISGIFPADSGRIFHQGLEITRLKPADIALRGIARTFQVPRTFNEMSVRDNLRVPLVRTKMPNRDIERRTGEMLSHIRLESSSERLVKELSGGQRKLLELARAIIVKPSVLILDEPFSGASSDVIDLTLGIVSRVSSEGTACLAISHDIVSMPRLCRDVIVLIGGAMLTRGPLETVRRDPTVIEAYLGN